MICDEFQELAGDRAFADDNAIVGGPARIDGRPVMVIGHERPRHQVQGAPQLRHAQARGLPQGAAPDEAGERFGLPILTFIDTMPAPGPASMPRNAASQAIARNLLEMAELKVPIVCTVIGEGGSGGALAIGVGDRTLMLEYSTYSVITPGGCASILWRDAAKAKDAAEQMGITAKRLLLGLGLIRQDRARATGGAHRNPVQMARRLKAVLLNELDAALRASWSRRCWTTIPPPARLACVRHEQPRLSPILARRRAGRSCAVHAIRTGRPMYWLFLLLIGSYIAVVIYVIAEVVPEECATAPAPAASCATPAIIIDPERHSRDASASWSQPIPPTTAAGWPRNA